MKLIKQRKIYYYEEQSNFGILDTDLYKLRTAKIYFGKEQDIGELWEFDLVKFKPGQVPYAIEDWKFLSNIYKEINRLEKKLNS